MSIPTRSIDNFVAQVRGASICVNNALSEMLDWNIPQAKEVKVFLEGVSKSLRLISDEFDKTAHPKEK